MSQHTPNIKRYATRLRLSSIGSNLALLLGDAERNRPSYDEFLSSVLSYEVKERERKRLVLQTSLARLPINHDLELLT